LLKYRSWSKKRVPHRHDATASDLALELKARMNMLYMTSVLELGLTPSTFILGEDAWRWRRSEYSNAFMGVPVDLHGDGGLILMCHAPNGDLAELWYNPD
jgi:hypothetical protein